MLFILLKFQAISDILTLIDKHYFWINSSQSRGNHNLQRKYRYMYQEWSASSIKLSYDSYEILILAQMHLPGNTEYVVFCRNPFYKPIWKDTSHIRTTDICIPAILGV